MESRRESRAERKEKLRTESHPWVEALQAADGTGAGSPGSLGRRAGLGVLASVGRWGRGGAPAASDFERFWIPTRDPGWGCWAPCQPGVTGRKPTLGAQAAGCKA